ncbi:MAG TPA: hypothetical protein H9680_00370 [Firmicutes bacterium]|nr:hypothetical protein [Bacillota bacterium]
MSFPHRLADAFSAMFWYSKGVLQVGYWTMCGLYTAVLLLAPWIPTLVQPLPLAVFCRGLLEAAPATFAAAVAAALLIDLVAKGDLGQ